MARWAVGFRVDWNRPSDQFTVLGNAYRDGLAQPAPGQISISFENIVRGNIKAWGENLAARWSHGLEGGGNLSVQTYYDGTDRTVQPTFGESLDIFDLQVQHSLPTLGNHALVWGAQYRYDRDRVRNSEFVAFLPADVDQKWASLFGQDEVALGKDLLWTAVSRTVRAPSRLDRDTFAPGNPPFVLAGGPDFRSETANVYEVGYRGLPAARFSYSITVYHTDYDHLHTLELAPSRTSVIFANQMQGHANGIETWGTYQAASFWQLSAGFVQLSQKLQLKPGSLDPQSALATGRDPAQSWTLRSSMDLPYQTELDAIARHVTALSNPSVPAYLAVDLRVGWKPREQVELSMAGQNLFGTHSEFAGPSTRSELGPSVFFKILGRFL